MHLIKLHLSMTSQNKTYIQKRNQILMWSKLYETVFMLQFMPVCRKFRVATVLIFLLFGLILYCLDIWSNLTEFHLNLCIIKMWLSEIFGK